MDDLRSPPCEHCDRRVPDEIAAQSRQSASRKSSKSRRKHDFASHETLSEPLIQTSSEEARKRNRRVSISPEDQFHSYSCPYCSCRSSRSRSRDGEEVCDIIFGKAGDVVDRVHSRRQSDVERRRETGTDEVDDPGFRINAAFLPSSSRTDNPVEKQTPVFCYDTGTGTFWNYFVKSFCRDQGQHEDKERLAEKSRRIQTFLSVPFEVEKVMALGTIQCADAFLYIFTIFPIRLCIALYRVVLLLLQTILHILRIQLTFSRRKSPQSPPSSFSPSRYPVHSFPTTYVCETIKGCFIFLGVWAFTYVDLSVMYHFLRGQAVVKLYIMFNMLEVADRLCSSFGQDILESLFWTASSARLPKENGSVSLTRQIGIVPQIITALLYVMVHSVVVLIQITTLNIAMNSQNRALLIILLSNNFVEIKGSVFKKFEKKNLYQISCSDIRERFQFLILLLMVIIRNMTELGWKMENLLSSLPDAFLIIVAEIVVDWTKHAFITKFNEIPMVVYQDYMYSLAYDFANTQLDNNKFADPSDSVVRRMGFLPIPLAIIVVRIVYQSFRFDDWRDWLLLALGYVCLLTTKLLTNIYLMRWCYNLIIEHRGKHRQERLCRSTPGTRAGSMTDLVEVAERARSAPNTPPPQPHHRPRAPSVGQTPLFANSDLELTIMNESVTMDNSDASKAADQTSAKDMFSL